MVLKAKWRESGDYVHLTLDAGWRWVLDNTVKKLHVLRRAGNMFTSTFDRLPANTVIGTISYMLQFCNCPHTIKAFCKMLCP